MTDVARAIYEDLTMQPFDEGVREAVNPEREFVRIMKR